MRRFDLTAIIYRQGSSVALIAVLTCWVCAQTATPSSAAPAGWNRTWSDEFDGSQVDPSKWDLIDWTTPFNNEQQAYHPSRVTVSDGNLVLTADDADYGGKSYTSGKVESKFTQQYGRWEIRAQLSGTRGSWPAIWLLPDTGSYLWPSQGEIDIMENRGDRPHVTSSAYHYGANASEREFLYSEEEASNAGQLADFHNSFHTYAVEWDAERVRFFVDDVNYYTIHDADTGGFLGNQTAPVEINLNLAVGGDFVDPAQPDGSSVWPQQMLIDYVRVYERDFSPPPVVFINGDFDAQGGSLAGWSTFGDVLVGEAVANVSTHNEATLSGTSSLKLIGQSNNQQNYSGVTQGISVAAGDSISASMSALVRAAENLVGSNTVDMKFDYYSKFGGAFGSEDYLGSKSITIAQDSTANDVWQAHVLTDTVPTGAVEARLSLVFSQPENDGGAIHIDNVSFENISLAANADADSDGDVDGADFLSWQRGLGQAGSTSVAVGDFNFDGVVDAGDLAVWEQSYQELAGLSADFVPEPTGLALAVMLAILLSNAGLRR